MDRYRRAMPIANKKMREHYVKQCDELHAKRVRHTAGAFWRCGTYEV